MLNTRFELRQTISYDFIKIIPFLLPVVCCMLPDGKTTENISLSVTFKHDTERKLPPIKL